jgi:UDP-glucuronate decarboxylase|tara:strand:+ start:1169 stop:2125 length:957 start_codon:yes stop_codon:yes gene_type:complete
MIILVTGGTGFIGSNLCNELVKNKSNHIICLDNNFTGSLDNIKHLRKLDNFEFIRHDICNEILLEVDQIYHLACPASPKDYQINGIKTIKTNILGTMNMLGLAKRTNARILLTSTSEVYGDPKISPQKENYWGNVNPIGIRSCYDEGKRLAETLMMEYHRNCKVDIRIVRIFNTYGPKLNKDDGRVVSNFINQALLENNITIYGDGKQTRSFCFIDDLVKGLLKMMNSKTSNETTTPINLGNPNEITMLELAEKIINITNSKSKLVFSELPKDDPFQRKPDINKALNVLEWAPLVNLDEGLKKTINYFKTINHFKTIN